MTLNPDFKAAFGNSYWTAGDLYREVMLDYASRAQNTLECGSGLTTLDMARAGVKGVALEHLPEWTGYCHGVAMATGVDLDDTFQIITTPLVDFGKFEWYGEGPKGPFDFVVCDGPPRTVKGGRYGLLPLMHERLTKGAYILWDDYYEEETSGMWVVDQWEKLYHTTVTDIFTPEDGNPFAVLQVP